jgi:hypothetical protein
VRKKIALYLQREKQKRSVQTGITGKLIMNDGLTWQGTIRQAPDGIRRFLKMRE